MSRHLQLKVAPPEQPPQVGDLVKMDRNGHLARWSPGDKERCLGSIPPGTRFMPGGLVLIPSAPDREWMDNGAHVSIAVSRWRREWLD